MLGTADSNFDLSFPNLLWSIEDQYRYNCVVFCELFSDLNQLVKTTYTFYGLCLNVV